MKSPQAKEMINEDLKIKVTCHEKLTDFLPVEGSLPSKQFFKTTLVLAVAMIV